MSKAEVAIYKSLHELGVQPSQVRFRKVVHRFEQDKQWDYAELEVSLLQGQNVNRAADVFARNLSAVPGRIGWKSPHKTDSELELLVRVKGVPTHRLVLHTRQKRSLEKPLPAAVAQLAIVIDDLGYDWRLAQRFLDIEAPLSFSVLPHGTFSESIACRIYQTGGELLLHLPMEPKGYPRVDPGTGALLVGMTDAQLVQTLKKDLDSLPYIVGVNNHMGSRFCEYEEKMRLIMEILRERDLYFLDSRTSSKSKAYSVARQLGLPSVRRDVFLDNLQDAEAIRIQMKRLVHLARLRGKAIGIAHPHEATLGVLKQTIPRLPEQGVELVTVSQLLRE
ncbi:MAG: divergent polysaccharide deacetylase family protein [Syntrophobacteria bacterium]